MHRTTVKVAEGALDANQTIAEANRADFDRSGVEVINLMSAPGSGKTTLLEKTLPELAPEHACAVLVGDLQTTRDAERLGELATAVTQINTGRGCHLDAAQVAEGLRGLPLDQVDFLFIENVGNLVCPAAFDLGEHRRVVLLSTPEGDDKVAKYPTLFQLADAILLTKVDLLRVLEYDIGRVRGDLSRVNTRAPLFELSSQSGRGVTEWLTWLRDQYDARGDASRV